MDEHFLLPKPVKKEKLAWWKVVLFFVSFGILFGFSFISMGQMRLREMRDRGETITRRARLMSGSNRSNWDAGDFERLYTSLDQLTDEEKDFCGVICIYDQSKRPITSIPINRPGDLTSLEAMAAQNLSEAVPMEEYSRFHILICDVRMMDASPPFYYSYVLEAWVPASPNQLRWYLIIFIAFAIVPVGYARWQKKRNNRRRPPMNEFTLTWLGQGGYALSIGGKTIYLDPYLSNILEPKENLIRLVPPPIAPADAHPDYYLATHDHMDHLDTEFIRQMDPAGVRFICPESCRKALLALGTGIEDGQITVVKQGDVLELEGFTLCAVYADHTPDSVGFVITAQGIALYITGDTLYNENVAAGVDADVICCCTNGRWGNMNAEEALRVALRSGAKVAIPNHYGMFARNTADPAEFTGMAEAAGLRTYTLQHNETIDVKGLL